MNIVNQCKPGCQRKARRCPKQRSNATSDLNLTDMNSPVSSKSSHIEVILCNSYLIFFTRQILPYLQTINVCLMNSKDARDEWGGPSVWQNFERSQKELQELHFRDPRMRQMLPKIKVLNLLLLSKLLCLPGHYTILWKPPWSGLWWMLTIPAHGVFLKIWAHDIVSEGWCVHVHTGLSSFASNTNTDFLLLRSFKYKVDNMPGITAFQHTTHLLCDVSRLVCSKVSANLCSETAQRAYKPVISAMIKTASTSGTSHHQV